MAFPILIAIFALGVGFMLFFLYNFFRESHKSKIRRRY